MYKKLMRSILVVIHGAVSPPFLRAIRAILDFCLEAQSPRHTPSSLARMSWCLDTFHRNKYAIADAGGRGNLSHRQIPKLEMLQNFMRSIISHGTLPQWSADATGRLLRTEAKHPFTHVPTGIEALNSSAFDFPTVSRNCALLNSILYSRATVSSYTSLHPLSPSPSPSMKMATQS